jgi:hypothetical protein
MSSIPLMAGVFLAAAAILGQDSVARAVVTVMVGVGCFLAIWWRWEVVGARMRDELDHGYTTVTVFFGSWWGDGALRRPGFGRRTPWLYAGVWVLDGRTGIPTNTPDPDVDPPGYYNIPERPGEQRFWTGAVWTDRYRPFRAVTGPAG